VCTLTKPVVDGLEQDLTGRATVHRIDFMSPLGREVAAQYGVDYIPTLLLFDGNGQLIIRQQGLINADRIRYEVLQEDVP